MTNAFVALTSFYALFMIIWKKVGGSTKLREFSLIQEIHQSIFLHLPIIRYPSDQSYRPI